MRQYAGLNYWPGTLLRVDPEYTPLQHPARDLYVGNLAARRLGHAKVNLPTC